jgi:hypothetical protein
VPSLQVKALVQQDPVGWLAMLRTRLAGQASIVAFNPGDEGSVSADGISRLIVVKPKGAPFDTDFCKALFKRLAEVEVAARQAVADVDSDAAKVKIQAAGAYRVSIEAEQLIRRESTENAIGSLVLLLLLVFLVFRTPWIMLYGSLPLALGAVLALGIAGGLQGALSPATSGSAGMLFGLGIDGVVILYMRYLEARAAGRSGEDATRAMGGTASSVVLAQATTAATFGALLLIDFPTLQDLGALVGVGILFCCLFTLLLLPALLRRRDRSQPGRLLRAAWLGRSVTRYPRAIASVGIVATIVLAAAATKLRIDTSMSRLQARTPGAEMEHEIARRFSLPEDVLLVVNESDRLEPLLEAGDRLSRAVQSLMPSVVTSGIGFMLPSMQQQLAVADVIRDSGGDTDHVGREVERAATRVGFRPNVFAPFLERLPRLLDSTSRITYDGLVSHGLDSIVSRFLIREGGRYEAVTYLYPRGTVDVDALADVVHSVDPNLRLTGLPVIDYELRRQFLPQFLKGIAIGTGAVVALIFVVFRTFRHTALAMMPTGIGFVWSAGILALIGVELDLFSLFAAVTFVGIAVDYGIYVLYRYVFERPRDVGSVLTHTAAAILIAAATALIGFGSLVNSSYGPLRTFGVVSVVTLACCLLASIVLLPAVLVWTETWSPSAP